MPFNDLFGIFSRRHRESREATPLSKTFRHRVLMLCLDTFGNHRGRDNKSFWDEIHSKLKYLVGRQQLAQKQHTSNIPEDVLFYLQECDDAGFLDFIELIFKTEAHSGTMSGSYNPFGLGPDPNHFVEAVNNAFLFDDLPFAITRFVFEKRTKTYYQSDKTYEEEVIVAYPLVICREDEITHTQAVEPTLALLRDKRFTSANLEFLEALVDYRKGDFGDCLTKCGSAFESTMKIICDRKNIPYDPNKDTAAPLIKKLLKDAPNLETYFDSPLMIVATLRNRLSKSHGAGTQQRTVPPHLAKYALNTTAAAILLLVEEFSS